MKISKSITLSAIDRNNNKRTASFPVVQAVESTEVKKSVTVENLSALEQAHKVHEETKLKHSASFSRYLLNIEQGRFDEP
jgi:hypothetical protein